MQKKNHPIENKQWLVDYHIHTSLSDGTGSHEEYIKAALKRNIDEIGFSEHICLKDVDWSMQTNEIRPMVDKITKLKQNSSIIIKLGIEIDYFAGYEDKIEKIIEEVPFDYVIGSVHFIGDWCFDNSDYLSEYDKWDIFELYKEYFKLLRAAAKSKLFDIFAHPDVVKKYGYRPERPIEELFIATAEDFKESGICIEINTNGLNKPCREIYPSKNFLNVCFQKGVPITLGSDAHRPEQIGQYFDAAIKMVKESGYSEISQFVERRRKAIPLV